MRLIDAEHLKKRATNAQGDCWDNYGQGTADFLEYIDKEPTVDAEPVRHGKWTHNKWSNMRHDYSCSLCGCRISGVDPFSLSATAYYYCPECGAKMDEVEDG